MHINLNLTDKAASSLVHYFKRIVVEVVEGDKQVVAYDLGNGETAYRFESKHYVDEVRRQAAKDKLAALAEERVIRFRSEDLAYGPMQDDLDNGRSPR